MQKMASRIYSYFSFSHCQETGKSGRVSFIQQKFVECLFAPSSVLDTITQSWHSWNLLENVIDLSHMAYKTNNFSPQNTKTNIISVNALMLHIKHFCQLVPVLCGTRDIKLNIYFTLFTV